MNQENKPAQAANNTFLKIPLFEIKGEGVVRFRIIANLQDPDELPFEQVFIHLGFIHPNFGKKVPLPCLGKGCPLCQYFRQKENQGDALAWKYQSNQKFIYYALNENMEIVLLSLTYTQQDELRSELISGLKSGVNLMDLNAGRWVQFTTRVINKKRKYIARIENDIHSIPQEIRNKFKGMRPLKSYYKMYKEEELRKILRGEKLNLGTFNPGPKAAPNQNQDPNPPSGEEKKYKPLQKMVETKPVVKKKAEYTSEVVDKIDGDDIDSISENAQLLEDILKGDD